MKLIEGSTVAFGAKSNTPFTGFKSANPEDVITKMKSVYKAIRNGKFENEEFFELLDIYHKQLEQTMIDLTTPTSCKTHLRRSMMKNCLLSET